MATAKTNRVAATKQNRTKHNMPHRGLPYRRMQFTFIALRPSSVPRAYRTPGLQVGDGRTPTRDHFKKRVGFSSTDDAWALGSTSSLFNLPENDFHFHRSLFKTPSSTLLQVALFGRTTLARGRQFILLLADNCHWN